MIPISHAFEVANALPFFAFTEDFLGGVLLDSTGGTPAQPIADLTSSYVQAAAEAAVASLAIRATQQMVFVPTGSGTFATTAANGGWITLSGAATTDNSGGQLQSAGIHSLVNGKRVAFQAVAQVVESTSTNGATESSLFAGLYPIDTSLAANIAGDFSSQNANWIGFYKADGGTTISCRVRVGGSNVFSVTAANSSGTITFDKSSHVYGIIVEPVGETPSTAGLSKVTFTIDGQIVAQATGINLPASSVLLASSVAFTTGDNTGTKTCTFDIVRSAQDR